MLCLAVTQSLLCLTTTTYSDAVFVPYLTTMSCSDADSVISYYYVMQLQTLLCLNTASCSLFYVILLRHTVTQSLLCHTITSHCYAFFYIILLRHTVTQSLLCHTITSHWYAFFYVILLCHALMQSLLCHTITSRRLCCVLLLRRGSYNNFLLVGNLIWRGISSSIDEKMPRTYLKTQVSVLTIIVW